MVEWAIVAARFLQFSSALVLFGSPLFYLYGFKAGMASWPSRRWAWPRLIVLIAAAGALVGAIWLVLAQTAIFFPEAGAFDLSSAWYLLTETRFGRVYLLRIGLLVLSLATSLSVSRTKAIWISQSLLGGVILATFSWTGHGIFNEGLAGVVHAGGNVLHLLAAGVWIGALLPLSILILHSFRAQTEEGARRTLFALESFSGIGPAAVAILVLTGLINSWFLIGLSHWRGLFTTAYGLLLVFKLVLFGLMLLLAAVNRFSLTPLLGTAVEDSRVRADSVSMVSAIRALRRSVIAESVLALLVLAAVSLLGTLEPPIAAEIAGA